AVTSLAIPPLAAWHTVAGIAELPRRRGQRPEAVLLDRDGTLIVDVPYNGDPERVQPMAGAAEALDRLRRAAVPTAVVTNRSGRPRGHGADAGDARARGCRRGRRCPQPARGRRSAAGSGVMSATLVARMDSAGDVLLAGPAIRAVAAGAGPVAALCGHRGRAA